MPLFFEIDDYLSSVQELKVSDGKASGSSVSVTERDFAPGLVFLPKNNGKRGPPGAASFPDSVPLRIWHSVFRI